MSELKLCPFCGNAKLEVLQKNKPSFWYYFVNCDRCQTCGPQSLDKGLAIKAWNKRLVEEKTP